MCFISLLHLQVSRLRSRSVLFRRLWDIVYARNAGQTVDTTNMTSLVSVIENNAIVSFDAFIKEYNLYPHSAFSTFHIVRDIMIKQEVREIALEDGAVHGMDGYMIRCVTKLAECNRVIVPFSADHEIDLLWLREFLIACRGECIEVYVCICTPESIIYELVEVDLV